MTNLPFWIKKTSIKIRIPKCLANKQRQIRHFKLKQTSKISQLDIQF